MMQTGFMDFHSAILALSGNHLFLEVKFVPTLDFPSKLSLRI